MFPRVEPTSSSLRLPYTALGLVALLLSAVPASSQDPVVKVHGFGTWAYGVTDGNTYLIGSDNGVYDNAIFSLNVSSSPVEKLNLVSQIKLEDESDDLDIELDYAFAEWTFTDALKLRVGRAKHPFGIYSEIFDVGTLRPFVVLPQGIYGPQGVTARSYDGFGITGLSAGLRRWGLQYDVYVGQIEGDTDFVGILSGNPDDFFTPIVSTDFVVRDLIGTRLNFSTPLEGLLVGLSAYHGEQEFGSGTDDADDAYDVYAVHLEYLTKEWLVRSEYTDYEITGTLTAQGAYAELARRFKEHWQVAIRFDWWEADVPGFGGGLPPPILAILDATLEHRDVGLALNYWFTDSFVLKLNFHLADGNRFAFPGNRDEILRAAQTGIVEDQTNLLIIGGQFSF